MTRAPGGPGRRRWWGPILAFGLFCGPAAAADAGRGLAAKIHFDLSALNAAGLYGPPDGLRALSYEFCIPDRPDTLAEVRGIDASLRVHRRARGRVGCVDGELLAIGSTHQPGYRDVLAALARLPYVARIEQAFFE